MTSRFAAYAALAVSCLAGCASLPDDERAANDPWEGPNRTVFAVNVALDKALSRPLAKGYRAVVPAPARTGVSNFFDNLGTPASALNNFLQGKPARGFSETARFLLNSTVGIGGIFDVATAGGMSSYPEDFGQTAAVWGVGDGPYVMLPFVGPKTLRDAVFLPLDFVADPLFHYENSSVRDPLVGLQMIDLRYRLLSIDKFLDESQDPYLTMRESYLQNRNYDVYDGDPPEEDDEFFDEFLEEDY